MQATPAGTVPMTRSHADELRPPDLAASPQSTCGSDPKTGQPFRFNPQTGQSCNGLPQERVVVRQPNAIRTQPIAPTPIHEETPEERRIAAAYQFEQAAIQAPTSVRNSATSSPPATTGQPTSNGLSQVEALSRALGIRQSGDSAPLPNGQAAENDYDTQNMQSRKEAFLTGATQARYRGIIDLYLIPTFGSLCLRDLTPLSLQKYISGFRIKEPEENKQPNPKKSGAQQQLARESVDKIRDVLSSVLGSAVKYGYIITNPAEAVQLPPSRRGARRHKPFIRPEQFAALAELIQEP